MGTFNNSISYKPMNFWSIMDFFGLDEQYSSMSVLTVVDI